MALTRAERAIEEAGPDDNLWLPSAFLEAESTKAEEDLLVIVEFRKQLRLIDERLGCVHGAGPPWPKWPRWYIIRTAPEGRPYYWVVEDEQGEYCVPDQRHLDRLMEIDGERNPKAWYAYRTFREKRERERQKRIDAKSEEFQEKLLDAIGHIEDTRIPVSSDAKRQAEGGTPTLTKEQRRARYRERSKSGVKLNGKSW
jgi:hypothetical protein